MPRWIGPRTAPVPYAPLGGEVRALVPPGLGQFRGERVPTLAEALDQLKGRVRVNIEVKVAHTPLPLVQQAIDTALDTVAERGMFGEVVFSSFSLDALYWVKRLHPRAEVALLDWDRETYLDRQRSVVALGGGGWFPHPTLATPERVRTAHERGLFVVSGGGNDPKTRSKASGGCARRGSITSLPTSPPKSPKRCALSPQRNHELRSLTAEKVVQPHVMSIQLVVHFAPARGGHVLHLGRARHRRYRFLHGAVSSPLRTGGDRTVYRRAEGRSLLRRRDLNRASRHVREHLHQKAALMRYAAASHERSSRMSCAS